MPSGAIHCSELCPRTLCNAHCKSLCRNEPPCLSSVLLWGPRAINTYLNRWADKKSASTGQRLLGYLVANGKEVCLFQPDLTQTSFPSSSPTAGMLRPYAESSATSQQTSISNLIPFLSIWLCFSGLVRREFVEFVLKRLTDAHAGEENTEIKDKDSATEVCQECFGCASRQKPAHWMTKSWNYNPGDGEKTFCWGGIIFLNSVMTKSIRCAHLFSTLPILSHT